MLTIGEYFYWLGLAHHFNVFHAKLKSFFFLRNLNFIPLQLLHKQTTREELVTMMHLSSCICLYVRLLFLIFPLRMRNSEWRSLKVLTSFVVLMKLNSFCSELFMQISLSWSWCSVFPFKAINQFVLWVDALNWKRAEIDPKWKNFSC